MQIVHKLCISAFSSVSTPVLYAPHWFCITQYFADCHQLARYMNIRKFLVTFMVKYIVDWNSSIWFDEDHLCCYEEELTDLLYLMCESPGESVAFILVPNRSWPAWFWICIHCVIIWNYCVYCQFVSLRVWSLLFWPAAPILWCLFIGRCLYFYMIFLLKYLFAIVVIVGSWSTMGVPKCLKAWTFVPFVYSYECKERLFPELFCCLWDVISVVRKD